MEDKIIFSAAVQQISRLILAEISRFRDLEAGAAQPCTAQQPALPTLRRQTAASPVLWVAGKIFVQCPYDPLTELSVRRNMRYFLCKLISTSLLWIQASGSGAEANAAWQGNLH